MSLEGKTIHRVTEYNDGKLIIFTDGTSLTVDDERGHTEECDTASTTEILRANAKREEDDWLSHLRWEREDSIRRAMSCEERTARKHEREEKERQAREKQRAELAGISLLMHDTFAVALYDQKHDNARRFFGEPLCADCGETYCFNAPKQRKSCGAPRFTWGSEENRATHSQEA